MTALPWEGYVRRKRPRAAAYCRYDDHDTLIDWIIEHAHFTGMHSIDGRLHGQELVERWYINGQQVDLSKGMYLVIENDRPRAYTAIEMAEFFDVTEEVD